MYLNGLDELDQKIVQLLIKNARLSYSDIGKEVGISRVAVKARIQALEKKGVIEEYTTIINPQKISGAISCYFEIAVGASFGVSYFSQVCSDVARKYRAGKYRAGRNREGIGLDCDVGAADDGLADVVGGVVTSDECNQ